MSIDAIWDCYMKIKPLTHYTLFMFALLLLPVHAAQAACKDKKLVVVGDSLVAGYGLPPGFAFPEQLAISLKDSGYDITVINAGVSGDTTSGGLSRLDWSVGEDADIVVLELGANDALRGIPVEVTRQNLDTMINKLTKKGAKVMLAGMLAPPNMGPVYGEAFNAIYPELAESHAITLYPFFLDGVAAEPELNQADGIHPNTEGIKVMVSRFAPALETLLQKTCG